MHGHMGIAPPGQRKRTYNLYLREELMDRLEAHRIATVPHTSMSALVGTVLSDYLDEAVGKDG